MSNRVNQLAIIALATVLGGSAPGASVTPHDGDFPGSALHNDLSETTITKRDGVTTKTKTRRRRILIGKKRQTVTQFCTTRIYKNPKLPRDYYKWSKGGEAWEYKRGPDHFVKKRSDGYVVERYVDNSNSYVETIASTRRRHNIWARQLREHKRRMNKPTYLRRFKSRRR